MAESEARASFAVDMVDGVTPAAESAASAIKKLQSSIDADTKSLNAMNKAMKALKQAATPDVEAMNRLQKSIDGVKSRISANQAAIVQQGGNFRRSSREAKSLQDKLADLSKASSILPGPLTNVIGMLQRFIGAGSVARIAAFALAGAVVGIGVAAGKAAKSLTDFAISAANARRNELLMLEASTKLRTATSMMFGLAADKAADMQAAVDQVAASVSISREKVAGYAAQLERAGVRGANLKSALQAVSTAASGWGEEQASQTLGWAASLALTGGNVQRLADRVKNQIGGVVQKKMLSAEVQAEKLAESQAALFAGVNIEPLLKARKAFNDLFSQATNSGQALKRLLGGLVEPFIRGLELLARAAKLTMQHIILAVLRAENVWLRFRLAVRGSGDAIVADLRRLADSVKQTFKELVGALKTGIETILEYSDELAAVAITAAGRWLYTLAPAIWANVTAMTSLAVAQGRTLKQMVLQLPAAIAKTTTALATSAVGALRAAAAYVVGLLPAIWGAIVAFGTMAVAVISATWPFVAGVVAVWAFIKVLRFLWDWSMKTDWAAIGKAIIDGIIGYFKDYASAFGAAFAALAEVGANAFKNVFGIASPSKLMQQYGKDITAGMAVGIDAGKPQAEEAMSKLGVPSTAAPGTRSGGAVTIGTLNVTVGAGGSPGVARDVANAIKRELETVLETVAVQMGAPA